MSLHQIRDAVLSLPLTMIEKLVLLGLIRHAHYTSGMESFPGNERLQIYASARERAVQMAVRVLIERSFIEIQEPPRQHQPTKYRVHLHKIKTAAARAEALWARGRDVPQLNVPRAFPQAVKSDE